MAAPTPNFLLSVGGQLAIDCNRCRELRAPIDLALSLAAGGHGDTPIDRLTFRCHKCGGVGQPFAHGPGNMLIGREHYWPPEG